MRRKTESEARWPTGLRGLRQTRPLISWQQHATAADPKRIPFFTLCGSPETPRNPNVPAQLSAQTFEETASWAQQG